MNLLIDTHILIWYLAGNPSERLQPSLTASLSTGIAEGLMTTIHAMTATQSTVDGPDKKDWRR